MIGPDLAGALLPALVALPVVAALVALLDPGRRAARSVSLLLGALAAGAAGWLVLRTREAGSFEALGGLLRADPLSAPALFLGALLSLVALLLLEARDPARPPAGHEIALLNAATASAFAALLSADLCLLWGALWASTFCVALLLGAGPERERAGQAWGYLVATGAALVVALLGTLLVGASGGADAVGGFGWTGLAESSRRLDPALLRAGVLLALAGYGMKLALVPCHSWLTGIPGGLPSHVDVMLSGLQLNLGLYALLRLQALVRAVDPEPPRTLLMLLGGLSAVAAAAALTGCRDRGRQLAWLTVHCSGIAVWGIAIGGDAVEGALLLAAGHALAKPVLAASPGGASRTRLAGGLLLLGALPSLVLLSLFVILSTGFAQGRLLATSLLLASAGWSASALLGTRPELPPEAEGARCLEGSVARRLLVPVLVLLSVLLGTMPPAPLASIVRSAAQALEPRAAPEPPLAAGSVPAPVAVDAAPEPASSAPVPIQGLSPPPSPTRPGTRGGKRR